MIKGEEQPPKSIIKGKGRKTEHQELLTWEDAEAAMEMLKVIDAGGKPPADVIVKKAILPSGLKSRKTVLKEESRNNMKNMDLTANIGEN